MQINIVNYKSIEEFEGPILEQVVDDQGQVYVRKWCTCNREKKEETFILCKTTTARVKAYKDMKITMYDLLFEFNKEIILEVTSPEATTYQHFVTKNIDPKWGPQKDVMYDKTLAPNKG